MAIPDNETQKLIFKDTIDSYPLLDLCSSDFFHSRFNDILSQSNFNEVCWLNTPGPFYTCYTDNCGTGQIEAPFNVCGDENYHEFIFKQPINIAELKQTIIAASVDPFGDYFIDGNKYWTSNNILTWWDKMEERINFILERYKTELTLPDEQPHATTWKNGEKLQLFGPIKPVPENYKLCLDFYQYGLKEYLEWYILKLEHKQFKLTEINFDWTKRIEPDILLHNKTRR